MLIPYFGSNFRKGKKFKSDRCTTSLHNLVDVWYRVSSDRGSLMPRLGSWAVSEVWDELLFR